MHVLDPSQSLARLPARSADERAPGCPAQASAPRSHRQALASLQYRPDIDGLRALAVALVVVYHAFPRLRTGGFIGVDVFFVISGYLITQLILNSLQAGTFSLAEFYRRRVRRIAPALLLVLAACLIAGWLLMLPGELKWLGNSVKWCVPFLANYYFAKSGGYFDPAAELNPLIHLWSLGVEEQFYLVWPVLLFLAAKRGVTMRFMGAVIATSLIYGIWSAAHGTPHFYNPATRAWELSLGGILAAWQSARPGTAAASDAGKSPPFRPVAFASSILGVALIVAGGVYWTPDRGIPGYWGLVPTVGAALLIGAGARSPVNRRLLASRPMVFIGKISYPLYLWHWPLLAFTRVVSGHRPPAGIAALEVMIAGVAAYGTYRLIESPIRHGRLGRKAVVPLLTGLAVLALAGATLDERWIAGRVSGPLIDQWNAAVTDWYFPADPDPRTRLRELTVASHRKRTALFIGDSHIQQYLPRVQQVVDMHPDSARSAAFATYFGCPPLPDVHLEPRGANCADAFDYALKEAYRPEFDTVIFGAFWEDYFIGEYSPRELRAAGLRRTGYHSRVAAARLAQHAAAPRALPTGRHRPGIEWSSGVHHSLEPDLPAVRAALPTAAAVRTAFSREPASRHGASRRRRALREVRCAADESPAHDCRKEWCAGRRSPPEPVRRHDLRGGRRA